MAPRRPPHPDKDVRSALRILRGRFTAAKSRISMVTRHLDLWDDIIRGADDEPLGGLTLADFRAQRALWSDALSAASDDYEAVEVMMRECHGAADLTALLVNQNPELRIVAQLAVSRRSSAREDTRCQPAEGMRGEAAGR